MIVLYVQIANHLRMMAGHDSLTERAFDRGTLVARIIHELLKRGARYPPVFGRVASSTSGEGRLNNIATSARRTRDSPAGEYLNNPGLTQVADSKYGGTQCAWKHVHCTQGNLEFPPDALELSSQAVSVRIESDRSSKKIIIRAKGSSMSDRLKTRWLWVFPFLLLACSVSAQESKLGKLLARSPSPANAVSYMHLPSLSKLLADANLPLTMPQGIVEVWLVSELNTESMTPNWEAGYATVTKKPDADSLAATVGGYVDSVGDQKVVWSPKQSYLVPIGDGRIGFLRPARRPMLAAWIDSKNSHPIPAYLAQQAKQPEEYLSLMLSVDLENTFSPADLHTRLGSFTSLKGENPEAAAKLLSSVQGVSIIVGRHSLAECILSVQFGESPAMLAPIANALLSEVLNRNQTSAPEVASWKSKVEGNSLVFQGPISAGSLDGVLGVFSLQSHAAEVVGPAVKPDSIPLSGGSQMATVSKSYFDKVGVYVTRIRNYDAQSMGWRAKWDEQQARRIDELPTLNVDPLLLDYSANVSNALRGNSTSVRYNTASVGKVGRITGGYYGYYGGYYSGYDANRTVVNTANASYKETLDQIDKATSEIRRALTDKYQIQF